MRFFHLNFLNVQGILVQKNHNARNIFCQFSDVKSGGRSQRPRVLSQLVYDEPQCRPKES